MKNDRIIMLKIKNNRLSMSHVSFDLPNNFYLLFGMNNENKEILSFQSEKKVIKNGVVKIEMEFIRSEKTARELITDFENYGMNMRGEFILIKRGTGSAMGAFFNGIPGYIDLYAEFYEIQQNENTTEKYYFCLRVYLLAAKGKRIEQTVNEAFEIFNIRAFLDSIEYK